MFAHSLNVKQFIERTLSGATTQGQNESENNGNEGALHNLQSSKTGVSLSDCLMSYLGHFLEEFYPPAEMQSIYSTAPADWADK